MRSRNIVENKHDKDWRKHPNISHTCHPMFSSQEWNNMFPKRMRLHFLYHSESLRFFFWIVWDNQTTKHVCRKYTSRQCIIFVVVLVMVSKKLRTWWKILGITIAFNRNRKGKTRIWGGKQRNENLFRSCKIWASRPLHKIGLHHLLYQSLNHKYSDLKNFNWNFGFIHSFLH